MPKTERLTAERNYLSIPCCYCHTLAKARQTIAALLDLTGSHKFHIAVEGAIQNLPLQFMLTLHLIQLSVASNDKCKHSNGNAYGNQ